MTLIAIMFISFYLCVVLAAFVIAYRYFTPQGTLTKVIPVTVEQDAQFFYAYLRGTEFLAKARTLEDLQWLVSSHNLFKDLRRIPEYTCISSTKME